jgi:hypothetical protein
MTEQEFWAILLDVPEPQPIFYRAYYNSDGWVECYSMEDLPGKYVDIDQSTYVVSPYARVVNGKLTVIKPASNATKLVPNTSGTTCDPKDVCIVVDSAQTHVKWNIVNNEIN